MAKSTDKGKFRPIQLRNRLIDFDKKRTLELSAKDHPPYKISLRSFDVGGPGDTQFALLAFIFCLSFFRSLRQAHRSYWWAYSDEVFRPKYVPFGGFVDTPPHLGGQILPNANFRAKYKIVHIIEITSPIPTKLCTTINTTPNALCGWSKHVHSKPKMADNRHIDRLTYLCNVFTDRRENLAW